MKRILVMVLSLLLCAISAPFFSYAEDEKPVVRVGYFSYDGFSMPDGEGGMVGYAADYLDEIASYTGWTYEYIPGTVEECLNRLASGEIDLVGGLQYTDRRASYLERSKYEIGIEHTMLLVREDQTNVYYEDFDSFDKLRVGFIKGTYQITAMAQYAKENKFSYLSYYYDSVEELETALKEGELNAIVIGSLQRNDSFMIAAKFQPVPFYFLTGKNRQALLDKLNRAMDSIQTLDVNFNTKLNNKHYGDSMSWRVALTKVEQQYITEHPSLRIAYNDDWSPIDYLNHDTSENDGIASEVLNLISRRSGIAFAYIRTSSEEEAIEKLRSGEVDLIASFPSQDTSTAKKNEIYLTKSYYDVPVMLAALPGKEPYDIYSIAIPGNYASLLRYVKDIYPDAKYVLLGDTAKCVKEVQSGAVDAVFENAYILEQYFNGSKALVPEPILSTKSFLPISIGIRTDSSLALRSLLNKLISQISPEEINKIVIKETSGVTPFDPWLLMRTIAMPLIGCIFVLILCIVLRSRAKIKKYAFTDPLTGYSNKTNFMLMAEKIIWSKDPTGYAVVSLDIDKFKLINSMHGFDVGNLILKEIAELMRRDMGTGELFCREADDRFGLLLRIQSESAVETRLWKLIKNISKLPETLGTNFLYTISCGVYSLKKTDKDIYSAVEWANMARENAKERRQNWLSWYDDSMRKKVIEEQNIENRMEVALLKDEFHVYYQPKIRLQDETLAGAEALVRWKTESGEILNPIKFIPIFESNGFILKLDLYVFEQVCRQLSRWIAKGVDLCPISVNLSRVHLNEPDFYLNYTDILERYNIPPELIEIELTESMVFDNVLLMRGVISAFKQAKLKVSVDDFGSGYSSLNLLKDLSFDYLKLDKEFLSTAAVTERGKKIIKSTKYLADQLDMILLAEGVETQEQVDFLRSIGCDLVQGYYFSKPLPLEEFEQYAKW